MATPLAPDPDMLELYLRSDQQELELESLGLDPRGYRDPGPQDRALAFGRSTQRARQRGGEPSVVETLDTPRSGLTPAAALPNNFGHEPEAQQYLSSSETAPGPTSTGTGRLGGAASHPSPEEDSRDGSPNPRA